MDELFLIYINIVGEDWRGIMNYEFIFSDTTEDIDGDDWDAIPASGRPSPPYEDLVRQVGRLTTNEFKLDVIQESDSFSVYDSVDNVVALAWENMDLYEEYPEKRLAFHFGEKISEVEEKLYAYDLILEYNKTTNVGQKEGDIE